MRYAVNHDKLAMLGWTQKTSFQEGLKMTVDWYRNFGSTWWGDITHCLTAFPNVENHNKKQIAMQEKNMEVLNIGA
jgi:dTDP-glucose 4,6-dehydratase